MAILINFKDVVDSLIRKAGYNVTRIREKPPHNPIDVLSIVLRDKLVTSESFFFVQVGANDGKRWDPIYRTVIENDLAGILVEPLPDFFTELQSNYTACHNLIFENCALGPQDGNAVMYRAKRDAPVKDYIHGIASFNRNHVVSRVPLEYLEEVEVPILSPSSLLRKHKVSHIDLLQVDTEGYDYEIIRLFILEGWRPSIINYENVNLSYYDNLAAKKLLLTAGYQFLDVGIDTIALLKTV